VKNRSGGWSCSRWRSAVGSRQRAGPAPARPAGDGPALPAVPPAPPAGQLVFGSALPAAERYAQLLAGPAVERGLLGPREIPRLWERHLLNCAVVASLVPHPCSLVDLGSGAGLPGVVLAMCLPDCEVTLLEPMLRRSCFLEECVSELGLPNARVYRSRAEDAAGELAADVVTARAVAPLGRLVGMAAGLLRPGGILLAMKGARAGEELAAAADALRAQGIRDAGVVVAGGGKVVPAAKVVRLTMGGCGRIAR
jgi:16S rRNA (guanine527-N7)-methyltransferase